MMVEKIKTIPIDIYHNYIYLYMHIIYVCLFVVIYLVVFFIVLCTIICNILYCVFVAVQNKYVLKLGAYTSEYIDFS